MLKRAREVVCDFAGVLSKAVAPGVVEGFVGEWSEGCCGNFGVGEVGVDGLRIMLDCATK